MHGFETNRGQVACAGQSSNLGVDQLFDRKLDRGGVVGDGLDQVDLAFGGPDGDLRRRRSDPFDRPSRKSGSAGSPRS